VSARPEDQARIRYHADRPSAHPFRERERRRAAAGLVRVRDLIPPDLLDLLLAPMPEDAPPRDRVTTGFPRGRFPRGNGK
jgi:hypothetical protein